MTACLLGSCGESTYERLSVLGGLPDAQVGAIKVFGDASATPTSPTGAGGSDPVGSGGGPSAPDTGGSGGMAGTGGSGGSSPPSTVDSGAPASGGNGTGGLRFGSGGTTATGGTATPGSGGAGTGGAQSGGATAISSGGVTGTGGAGTGGAGTGGTSVISDPAHYNFEASNQGWSIATGTEPFTSIARSTTQHFGGGASLAGTVSALAGRNYFLEVAPPVPAIPVNATVTFHVFVPAAAQLATLRAYVLSDAFVLTNTDISGANLKRDAWTTITLVVPPSATNVIRLGVKLISSGNWTGTVYVDSIDW